ncbi:MAG: DUF2807 domain-containing protein [Muribaculaceae bacterium]|nr:DUF2807 domain-containing protein [Muribaculaceae bacterium]
MKRILIAAVAAVCALAAAAQTKDYSLRLDDFSELKVVDGINVVYHTSQDSAGLVTYTCAPEIADKIIFESGRKRLKIEVAFDENGPLCGLPEVHVYSAILGKVENSGDSTVTVNMSNALPAFKARVVGNGTLVVRGIYATNVEGRISTGHGHLVLIGRAATAKLSNVGTGPIEAGALEAKDVKCWMLGTGPVDCFATEKLTVLGAGSGTVYYKGAPKEIVNRTIGVKTQEIKD